MSTINQNLSTFNYVFIMLTETWLHSIFSSELGFICYNIFRYDRSIETSTHYRGGGVLVDIRSYVT